MTNIFAKSLSHSATCRELVDLGPGIPDLPAPAEAVTRAIAGLTAGEHQYAPIAGCAALQVAVAEHARRFYGMAIGDPDTTVLVTAGATEATLCSLLALIDPGDEVVVFDPCYDAHPAQIAFAGGVARYVPLQPPDSAHATWWFTSEALAAAFSARTKLVLLNTPHNPTGKVFSRAELEQIAQRCIERDAYAVTDEVYEHLVYANVPHVRIATLPGMAERTITVSSAAKSFSVTGWKVGWAIAPAALRELLFRVHQYASVTVPAPLQHGVAAALRLPAGHFQQLRAEYQRRRDALMQGLTEVGLPPLEVEGGIFCLVDACAAGFESDLAFCAHLLRDRGVLAIPTAPFFQSPRRRQAPRFVRFAFCKSEAAIREALRRLRAAAPGPALEDARRKGHAEPAA